MSDIYTKLFNFAKILTSKRFYKQARRLFAQVNQSLIEGPDVQIEPGIQADVQEAVKEIRATDPNFFRGVSKIVGLSGGPFGQVSSDDPTVIHVNINKIKQQVKQQLGSYNPSSPEHQQAFKESIKRAIEETISHEKGHVKDWNPEQHKFPGGEGVAESFEKQMSQKLHHDKPIELKSDHHLDHLLKKESIQRFNEELNIKLIAGTVRTRLKYLVDWDYKLTKRMKSAKHYIKRIKNATKVSLNETENEIIIKTIESFLKVFEELTGRYGQDRNLQDLEWYEKRFKVLDNYIKEFEGEWEGIIDQYKQIKNNILLLVNELPNLQRFTHLSDIDSDLVNLIKKQPKILQDHININLYYDYLSKRIGEEKNPKELVPLMVGNNKAYQQQAVNKYKELTESNITKQSQVGVESSTPGGNAVPGVQYGVTGNNDGAPYSTRVQELLKRLEKLKKDV